MPFMSHVFTRSLKAPSRVSVAVVVLVSANAVWHPARAQDPRAAVLDTFITELAARGKFNGNILVAAQGEVIYEKSIGLRSTLPGDSLDLDSQFRLASASKPFTALAIMQLEEAGLIDYEDPVEKYIPEWPYRGATIRNLLNHTSGIPDYREITDRHWKPELRMDNANRIVENSDQLIDLFTEYRPEPYFEPGSEYGYSDTGYLLLALILERVSGVPYHRYMRDNVFVPAGMRNTYAVSPLREDPLTNRVHGMRLALDGPGLISADFRYVDALEGSSGIYSTLRDLYRWDRALYTDQVVSRSSLREAFAPAVLTDGRPTRYGFGWFLGEGTLSHDGYAAGFGVWIYRELDRENTVIMLTTGSMYLWAGVNQGVLRILRGENPDLPKRDGMRMVGLALLNEGEEAARRVYADLRQNHADEYDLGGVGSLNSLGRLLLADQRPLDALAAFRLSAELYPEAPLVWNWLAEAYLSLGDTTNAVENYRRALTLDEQSRHARQMLQMLGRR